MLMMGEMKFHSLRWCCDEVDRKGRAFYLVRPFSSNSRSYVIGGPFAYPLWNAGDDCDKAGHGPTPLREPRGRASSASRLSRASRH